jgi:hypothetical protein
MTEPRTYPTDMTQAYAVRQFVDGYCKKHQHSFITHDIHTKLSWEGKLESYRPGCYALYTASGELLYIGKASNTRSVGTRLWHHFRKSSAPWMPTVAFVQIIEVSEPYEAPSFEEYLIRETQPRYNGKGIRRAGLNEKPTPDA